MSSGVLGTSVCNADPERRHRAGLIPDKVRAAASKQWRGGTLKRLGRKGCSVVCVGCVVRGAPGG